MICEGRPDAAAPSGRRPGAAAIALFLAARLLARAGRRLLALVPRARPGRGVRRGKTARSAFGLAAAAGKAALFAAVCFCLPPSSGRAGDEPFAFSSNAGFTGLFETPTARVLSEKRYRLGASFVRPYSTYFGSLAPFPRVEINGRVTAITGVQGFPGQSGYGRYKDKAVDLKVQLVTEGKYRPAVAIALFDPHGTRVFASQAVVASKEIYPFDFSFGLGNGRLGSRSLPQQGEGFRVEMFENPRSWWRDARPFGGIQFAPSDRWAAAVEYSPIRYERQFADPAQAVHFSSPVPSPFNFGLRLKPFRFAEIDASWQRGDTFALSASVSFEIGRPILPIYDPPYREGPARRERSFEERLEAALLSSGFSDVGVLFDGATLRIEAQNDRYFFTARAESVIIDILSRIEPGRAEYVRIVLKENGIPKTEFVTTGHGVAELARGGLSRDRFAGVSRFSTEVHAPQVEKTAGRKLLYWEIKPQFDAFLNDPSGFFKYRAGAAATLRANGRRGASAVAGFEGYPLNTVSTANEPLSIPVRSDVARYKEQRLVLSRLFGEQIVKMPGGLYLRLAAGILETMFAGADAEAALPVFNGRLMVGASGSRVRKRAAGEPFRLIDGTDYHTGFGTLRINAPEVDAWLDLKAGRFLAGDRGARIEAFRSINGVVLSAWYSATQTNIFRDPFNRGYHDKGISVSIPLRLFLGRDSKVAYRFALSPWTRDVAQDIDRPKTLFDWIGRDTGVFLDSDRRSLFTVGRQ